MRGDVGARVDDRGWPRLLAGHGDGAAAVLLGVGDARAATAVLPPNMPPPAARAGAPGAGSPSRRRAPPRGAAAPARAPAGGSLPLCAGARRSRRRPPRAPPKPPGAAAAEPAEAGPPAGKVPLVAWPSVWNAHAAGATSSAASPTPSAIARARRAGAEGERRRGQPGGDDEHAAAHPSWPGLSWSTTSSVTTPPAIASGPERRAPAGRR